MYSARFCSFLLVFFNAYHFRLKKKKSKQNRIGVFLLSIEKMLPKNGFFFGRVSKSEQNRGMILEKKNVFKKSPNFLRQTAYHDFSKKMPKKHLC